MTSLEIRPPFPEVIDSTMRGAFVSCPHKFYWEFIRRIGPKKLSIHLHFGACFARGLEVFRKEFYSRAHLHNYHEVHKLALGKALEAMILEWGDYPPEDEEPKTLWHCMAALDFYFEVHPPFSDVIQPFRKADNSPAVEFSFALPLNILHPETGEPILYAGRFDMLGVYDEELLYVVDEKTTGQMGPTWSSSWDLRAQFTGYVWAARTFGHQVAGAIARGVVIRKTGLDHGDAIIPVTDWQIERWKFQLERDIQRMISSWEESYWDYDLDSACTSYGGCGFKSLCLSNNPERWIESSFAPRHWNPVALDPLKEDRLQKEPLIGVILGEEVSP